MKKNHVLVTLFILSLVLVMAVPVAAGGATDKATGSGMWTNSQGDVYYAEFNAHEEMDNRPAKGMLVQTRISDGASFTVDVDTVTVFAEEGYACFSGITVEATGLFADRDNLGDRRYTKVVDGGEGIDGEGDYLIGSFGSSVCGADETANDPWTGGNVQIHAGKSYE